MFGLLFNEFYYNFIQLCKATKIGNIKNIANTIFLRADCARSDKACSNPFRDNWSEFILLVRGQCERLKRCGLPQQHRELHHDDRQLRHGCASLHLQGVGQALRDHHR